MDRLFAASPDKIRIYSISDGELSYLGSIDANNPRNIRVSDGKLFVADGRKVSIWNISGETPDFEREISTSYKVKDFEVDHRRLYIYEEESYWYWFWLRKKTKFEIIALNYDVGEETLVYASSLNCKDSEMMQDSDAVYLGCKNAQHRVGKRDGTVLSGISGEKRYFRDSYYYRGKVYQTFSGAVHISE